VGEDFYQTAYEHRKREKKNQNVSTQVETKISNKSNNKEKQQWLKRRETVLGRETKAKVKPKLNCCSMVKGIKMSHVQD
jgi:hypothetical protein